MRALIIDDEEHCRSYLKALLRQYCPSISETRTAYSVDNAVEVMKEFIPDVLFLDIRMPDKDGFSLLDATDTSGMSLIFVTAHDEFGIKAIKYGPTAYLLKPVDADELVEAVQLSLSLSKYRIPTSQSYKRALSYFADTIRDHKNPDRICLIHQHELELVMLRDIVFISSQNSYSIFKLSDNRTIVMARTLRYYENLLDDRFIRSHRSYLVNIYFIKSFTYKTNSITFKNGTELPVSRRKVSMVAESLKNLS